LYHQSPSTGELGSEETIKLACAVALVVVLNSTFPTDDIAKGYAVTPVAYDEEIPKYILVPAPVISTIIFAFGFVALLSVVEKVTNDATPVSRYAVETKFPAYVRLSA
jgi:hypothetical protein